jgi:preprotein translocase subunit SecE
MAKQKNPELHTLDEEPGDEPGADRGEVDGDGALVAADPGDAGDAAAREGKSDLEGDEAPVAGQLGANRYVMAGFFATAILGAFVLGKTVHGVWSYLSNKSWFSDALPTLAAVPDEDKTRYGMVLGALVAIVVMARTYRRADVREWTDDVAGELAKVKWPTRKEVSNSTIIVITASAVATAYLALLDRLWAFITNLVYGA